MHITPTRKPNTPRKKPATQPTSSNNNAQHGLLSPNCPPETLNWVTSYLTAKELLLLARVSRYLNHHVNQDSTWRSAFGSYFLGLDPETDWGNQVLLRRLETTWKKEFITRLKLMNRWQKSRNTTISHEPHHSNSASVLYLPKVSALLSASTTYGVVSRSLPFTGKVLKGYLDASGLLNGQGIGNPNTEFSPDVCSIALQATGTAAQVAWGFRNGDIAVTHAPKVMSTTRGNPARMVRSLVTEGHSAQVDSIVVGDDGKAIVTGGFDGRVKLWDANTVRCLWTWTPPESIVQDSCLQVAYHSPTGTIAAVFVSGDLHIWRIATGPNVPEPPAGTQNPPFEPVIEHSQSTPPNLAGAKVSLSIHAGISVVMSRVDERLIRRFTIAGDGFTTPHVISTTQYVDGPVGPITATKVDIVMSSITPPPTAAGPLTSPLSVFASSLQTTTPKREESVVIAGDALGRVSFWSWDDDGYIEADTKHIRSFRRFEAHEDGGVSAIAVGGVVMATGSARGTIRLWDLLTLQCLRTIHSPAARPLHGAPWPQVDHIKLEKDVLIGTVGSRVIAWQAGNPSHKASKGKAPSRGSGNMIPVAKWQQQVELDHALSESRQIMEDERRATQRAHGRVQAQRSTLDGLGLSEAEAVAYLLMVSREEDEARQLAEARRNEAVDYATAPERYEVEEGTATSHSTPSVTTSGLSSYGTPTASPTPGSPQTGRASSFEQSIGQRGTSEGPTTPPPGARSVIGGQRTTRHSAPPTPDAWSRLNSQPRFESEAGPSRTRTSTQGGSGFRRTLPLDRSTSLSQEDADLAYAIQLSLAEAKSRE